MTPLVQLRGVRIGKQSLVDKYVSFSVLERALGRCSRIAQATGVVAGISPPRDEWGPQIVVVVLP